MSTDERHSVTALLSACFGTLPKLELVHYPKVSTMTDLIIEIRWHGRGGQGAVTAARLIAGAAYLAGYPGVTAAPSFGAERRGVPVSALTRISRGQVRILSQVTEPDIVVVLDQTLLAYGDIVDGLKPDGWLIVNSNKPPAELGFNGRFNTATANATDVSSKLGLVVAGLTLVNTAMLGAFARATGLVTTEDIEAVLRERFPPGAADTNVEAIKITYDITLLQRIGT